MSSWDTSPVLMALLQGSRYVTAFKDALAKQTEDKKKQDAIRDQYEKVLVPRFKPVEHTEVSSQHIGTMSDGAVG